LHWLNNVRRGVLTSGFLASYLTAEFGRFLQVVALASHWLEDCANFTPTPEENYYPVIQRQPLLVPYKQQANPILTMNNNIPLVISWNDKNKQLTLLCQRKLALTARNTLFAL
jgi:hypothetical protein